MKTSSFIKNRLQHRFFPLNIPKVLGTVFFTEQLQWLILSQVLEQIKKVSERIAFALLSLFHLQIQQPGSISTTTREFVFLADLLNFIITKYLKQEVDDNFSLRVDERSPCSLFITGDTKIYQCHMIKRQQHCYPNGGVPYGIQSRSCFYHSHMKQKDSLET